jgi:TRAP-type C4-dicarboxylate transport system permease small subunit
VTAGAAAAASRAREVLTRLCERVALVGGVALLGAMLAMIATVVGGAFGRPLLGDSEIVELLGGITVFTFLPYCHLRGSNVIVDFFTQRLPERAQDWLDAAMNTVFAAVAVVLAWRLVEGGLTAFGRDKRSMFLQLPDWWGYSIGAAAMLLWIAVCLFIAWERLQQARGKLPRRAQGAGAFG